MEDLQMKIEDIKLYKYADAYMKAPEGMKNEMQMWFVASGLLMQELSKKMGNNPYGGLRTKIGYIESKRLKPIEILDVCSGLGNFVNHLSFVYPKIKAFCLDINKEFLEYTKNNGDYLAFEYTRKNKLFMYEKLRDREKEKKINPAIIASVVEKFYEEKQ